ncbi:hypothetical protein CEQ31_026705 [Serratia odorifera]|nr:hypothetical protein CEQ31_026705 [Serratia odorifera]
MSSWKPAYVNKEIQPYFVYTLDRASFLRSPRFRVTQITRLEPGLSDWTSMSNGGFGYLVYEQYEDAAPFIP